MLLAFMGLDELLRLHEAIDSAVNFDWQVLLLPLVARGRGGLGRGAALAS